MIKIEKKFLPTYLFFATCNPKQMFIYLFIYLFIHLFIYLFFALVDRPFHVRE